MTADPTDDLLNEFPVIHWGRCPTGTRWFWTAVDLGSGARLDGRTDTQQQATDQAHQAVRQLARGRLASVHVIHAAATARLHSLTEAQNPRRSRILQPTEPPQTDLKELKAQMRAAHPDMGGTEEAFVQARARYVAARNRQARSVRPKPD